MIKFASIAEMADGLRRAADAHHNFEKGLGRTDADWPTWYACFLAMEQRMVDKPVETNHAEAIIAEKEALQRGWLEGEI